MTATIPPTYEEIIGQLHERALEQMIEIAAAQKDLVDARWRALGLQLAVQLAILDLSQGRPHNVILRRLDEALGRFTAPTHPELKSV
jgi:hypothetical protein